MTKKLKFVCWKVRIGKLDQIGNLFETYSGRKNVTRDISKQAYDKNKWINGCDTLNALFYFSVYG